MKNTLVFGLTFFIWINAAYGQNDSIKIKEPFFKPGQLTLDILSFGRTTDFVNEVGTINPDNRIAKLNEYDAGLYLRPDIKYTRGMLNLAMKPRLNFDVGQEADEIDVLFYFQELKLKLYLNEKMFLTAGRYFKPLGPSIFINPSNPFFINSGRLNPKIELNPMDFVELNLSTRGNWSFTLIANVSKGEAEIYDEPFFDFERRYGLISEYYGLSHNLSTIMTITEDQKYHFGFNVQKTVNDAVVIWAETAFEYNIDRFYPVDGHHTGLLQYEMVNGKENENAFFSGLLGASYTFKFGPTLNLEYYYNGKGFSNDEFDLFNEMIFSSNEYHFGITRNLAYLNLGRGLNSGMPFLRRNYIFTQFGENDLFGKLSYNLRYFYSLDDYSNQLSSLIEFNAFDNLEIFTVFFHNFGQKQSDLKMLLNYQLMIGAIVKL